MRKLWLVAVCLTVLAVSYAQNFEGKLLYAARYKSKTPALKEEQLQAMLGTQHEYYIKDGNYKTVISNALVQWQLFVPADGKLYSKLSSSEAVLWNDAAQNTDSVWSYELNKDVREVAGYRCDELVLHCKSGTQKYYFNKVLKADPALLKKHRYGNWYDYLSRAAAVPLQYIIETRQFVVETTATEVAAMKLEPSFFEVPSGMELVQNPQ